MPETEKRVFIAGAGPVGLVAAASLARQGIPVTVFEASAELSTESRASTFHPPTLDMLGDIGVVDALIAQGLVAPTVQYRTRGGGPIAQFDFGDIADLTAHPYRLQSEQFKLTRIIADKFSSDDNLRIEFNRRVEGVTQDDSGVEVEIHEPDGSIERRRGLWLIGADGARSAVRKALDIPFSGFTWPERFLVVSTSFDFFEAFPDLSSVSYVADPRQWHFLLQVPGMWRVMFPIAVEVSDDEASSREFAVSTLGSLIPAAAEANILHTTLYRVHQRVADSFRKGRAFLAGDAAHINNPLGGMGMNGGVHDVVNLCGRLARVWRKEAPEAELDRYDLQRRLVTVEHVQRQTIENKRNLEASDPKDQEEFRVRMARTASEPAMAREYLQKISMMASLKRASELG
ncbi:FAD-dependent monooxygenase [Bradyrhizobium sp. dw_78]|uniref:FAD-dependent oxidoreductase n=1 Tax=Bradyrhizobium sp. dw_78 TaxID=2719793 RepID=UPI001BD2610E|nr:FAD-dependent monooxygenase [Bradyrhizobium sp. dw_78]